MMLYLPRSVSVVGPDRCWKSTLCSALSCDFDVEVYSGRRGTERITGEKLLNPVRTVFDRGIVCTRAYDEFYGRVASCEDDYNFCEDAMRTSGSIYIFLDRDDFTNVNDEKDKMNGQDLQRLSDIYKSLLPATGVPFKRFVVEDTTGTDHFKFGSLYRQVVQFIFAVEAAQ